MNLLCIVHRLSHYHCARFKRAYAAKPFVVLEVSGQTNDRTSEMVSVKEGFAYQTVFADRDSRTLPTSVVFRKVASALDDLQPDVVAVSGWADKAALSALYWAITHSRPVVLVSDSTQRDHKRVYHREFVKGKVVRLCASAFVAGAPHKRYLISLGISAERVFTGYDVVDNEYWSTRALEVRHDEAYYRRRYALPDRYFICVSRFAHAKNLLRLIDAHRMYCRSVPDPWTLVLVGNGELHGEIKRKITEEAMNEHILLTGFLRYGELPAFYALAECLILASISEPWGLVVNEAMATGLPVLASCMCGCQEDLVRDGANGFVFDPYDAADIAQKMTRMTASSAVSKEMGLRSRVIISGWGCDTFATNLWAAAQKAVDSPLPEVHVLDRFLLKALLRA